MLVSYKRTHLTAMRRSVGRSVVSTNVRLYFPYLLTDFDEIQYKGYARNAVERV